MMGVESFLVRFGSRQPDLQAVVTYAQHSLGIVPDPQQHAMNSAYSYYVFRDGLHVIEFEFWQQRESYDISMRFALCHPPSVDRVFLDHAVALTRQFDLTAIIGGELPEGEPAEYNTDNLERFAANCSWSIGREREYWQRQFGPEEMGLSVVDALRHFFFKENISAEEVGIHANDRR
jgi:hypothetical protein